MDAWAPIKAVEVSRYSALSARSCFFQWGSVQESFNPPKYCARAAFAWLPIGRPAKPQRRAVVRLTGGGAKPRPFYRIERGYEHMEDTGVR
jgi:hypothetical protein